MWNNYFFQIQQKYSMRISTKEPLVVRFDGRDITKNKDLDLLGKYDGSFLDTLEKTAKYFSEKYNCFSIFGSDEISFIVLNPNVFVEDLEPEEKSTHSQELIAMFSQYFFDYFNHFDTHQKIFWHGKCFSIPGGKVKSYIKYRSGIIKNVMVTYFAKRNNFNNSKLNLIDKLEICKAHINYKELEDIKDGILYYDGKRIDLIDYFDNDNIKEIKSEVTENKDYKYDENDEIEIELL